MLLSSAENRPGRFSWLPTPRFASGALDVLRVMREVNPAEVQAEVDAGVQVVVCASRLDDATRLIAQLLEPGATGAEFALARTVGDGPPPADRLDLVVIWARHDEDPWRLLETWQGAAGAGRPSVPTVVLAESGSEQGPSRLEGRSDSQVVVVGVDGNQTEALARALVPALQELLPRKLLAFGRRFPALRGTISERLIRETSRANAQFALLSSVPANIPIVGGLFGTAADLLMLTKNQALLVYKLAGLYGRDLDDRLALTAEIAPVVGGAFAWRTLARSLLGVVPGVIAGLPKAAVAFAGTFVVGQLAHYYYATGRRPSAEQVARIQEQAIRLARDLAEKLARWRPGKTDQRS